MDLHHIPPNRVSVPHRGGGACQAKSDLGLGESSIARCLLLLLDSMSTSKSSAYRADPLVSMACVRLGNSS